MKYTREQINELDGLELRAAVASEIFGLPGVVVYTGCVMTYRTPLEKEYVPHYESDHNAMMQVVAEMERRGCEWTLQRLNKIYAMFERGDVTAVAETESLPVAVCRAALLYACETLEAK